VLLAIDAEGHDAMCLAGASRTLGTGLVEFIEFEVQSEDVSIKSIFFLNHAAALLSHSTI
jgi:hypothetical protein